MVLIGRTLAASTICHKSSQTPSLHFLGHPREIGYGASNEVSLASLRSGQLLQNLQAAGLRIVTSSEQAAALREGEFMSFDSIIDISDIEAPSISQTS
ncbi:hypothetical protein EDB19DRAFT_1922879 [Suillus lakei]|nr:hypothetical protein EDB19DRAFT_1922879 [Suillus lakei]